MRKVDSDEKGITPRPLSNDDCQWWGIDWAPDGKSASKTKKRKRRKKINLPDRWDFVG